MSDLDTTCDDVERLAREVEATIGETSAALARVDTVMVLGQQQQQGSSASTPAHNATTTTTTTTTTTRTPPPPHTQSPLVAALCIESTGAPPIYREIFLPRELKRLHAIAAHICGVTSCPPISKIAFWSVDVGEWVELLDTTVFAPQQYKVQLLCAADGAPIDGASLDTTLPSVVSASSPVSVATALSFGTAARRQSQHRTDPPTFPLPPAIERNVVSKPPEPIRVLQPGVGSGVLYEGALEAHNTPLKVSAALSGVEVSEEVVKAESVASDASSAVEEADIRISCLHEVITQQNEVISTLQQRLQKQVPESVTEVGLSEEVLPVLPCKLRVANGRKGLVAWVYKQRYLQCSGADVLIQCCSGGGETAPSLLALECVRPLRFGCFMEGTADYALSFYLADRTRSWVFLTHDVAAFKQWSAWAETRQIATPPCGAASFPKGTAPAECQHIPSPR